MNLILMLSLLTLILSCEAWLMDKIITKYTWEMRDKFPLSKVKPWGDIDADCQTTNTSCEVNTSLG